MKTMTVLMGVFWACGVVAQAVGSTPESFLIDAAKQIPALGVLVWLVYANNKERRDFDKNRRDADAARDKSLEAIGQSCHDFQNRILERSQAALDRNTETLGRIQALVDRAQREKSP